jgi:hypothetical protein
MASSVAVVHGQDSSDKVNSNLGLAISSPLNPTAQYVHTGWGVVGGVGYNFTSHHSFVGEFMWTRLDATDGALQPLRLALQAPNLSGQSNLYAITGNYRYELRGNTLGTYFIGGGGLYYRTTHLSERVLSASSTNCITAWSWWGFNCSSGSVSVNQTIAGGSSTALGVNGGVGFTARVGEAPYRLYLESRYHYAPNKPVNTQLVIFTFGIRY